MHSHLNSRVLQVRAHSGFTLIELSAVLTVGAGFMLALLMALHSNMLHIRSQAMADRYKDVGVAVQQYMNLFGDLLTALPTDCSVSAYRVGSSASLPSVVQAGACSAMLTHMGASVPVLNLMQPQIKDLQQLALLDPQFSPSLLLEYRKEVYEPISPGGDARLASPQLAVKISRRCTMNPCAGAPMLEALVFNLQPFNLRGGLQVFSYRDQFYSAYDSLGSRGAISDEDASDGKLWGAKKYFATQSPLLNSSSQGVEGVLAYHSTWSLAESSLWARRDGQSEISGNWNFQSRDVGGIGVLQARDLKLDGQLRSKDSVLGKANADQLVTKELRLPFAMVGQVCDPDRGNVAWDESSQKLLRCIAESAVWEPTP